MATSFRFALRFLATWLSCACAQVHFSDVSVKLPGTSYGSPSPAPGGKYIRYMSGHFNVPDKPQVSGVGYFWWPGLAPYGECGMFQPVLGYGINSDCGRSGDQWCMFNVFSKCPGKGYCYDGFQPVQAGDVISWWMRQVSGMTYEVSYYSSSGVGGSMTQSCVGQLPVDAWSMVWERHVPYNSAAMPRSAWKMWGLTILDQYGNEYADQYQIQQNSDHVDINCYTNQCTMSFNPGYSYAESLTTLPPVTDCKGNKLCEDLNGYIPGRVSIHMHTGKDPWVENLKQFPAPQNQGPELNVSVIKAVKLHANIVGSSMSPHSLNEQSSETKRSVRKHTVIVDADGKAES